MPPSVETRATLDDLERVEGKAELIGGRIVRFMGTGRRPNRVSFQIVRSLDDYAVANARGEAYSDGMTFGVPELPSGRESFMPDASYYFGPFPINAMRWIDGPPTLAVEVRSENDYGPAAEIEMAARRLDYFEAGTPVVWDVDPINETIRSYRSDQPSQPITYARGEIAEAMPATPGWQIAVDVVFGG